MFECVFDFLRLAFEKKEEQLPEVVEFLEQSSVDCSQVLVVGDGIADAIRGYGENHA
jgi:hypothetical protein